MKLFHLNGKNLKRSKSDNFHADKTILNSIPGRKERNNAKTIFVEKLILIGWRENWCEIV